MFDLNKTVGLLLILLAICLFVQPTEAGYGVSGEISATGGTSTYIFLPDQGTVVQTGGIAGVHWTYSIEGQFQLTFDPNAGTAFFGQVDASAVDDSPYRRTLDPNEVFNMTGLVGIIIDDTIIVFAGKATDGSDILIIAILNDDLIYLFGQTYPPISSADFFVFSIDAAAQRKYGGGTGEPNEPYLIYTAEQMNAIGAEPNDWDKNFRLMADIDLSTYLGTEFNIIGVDRNNPFTGIFDGNNHTICNFTYTTTVTTGYIGLFGCVSHANAIVENLTLTDPNINAAGHSGYVGSLVGCLGTGMISGCSIEGGSVSGYDIIGGLAGLNLYGEISNCSATDGVWGARDRIGGLVGTNSGTISSCYATGNVSGYSFIGGLVGYNFEHITNLISNCYATGSVSGDYNTGGLEGGNYNGTISASFWDIETSGQAESAGGTGLTTAEMQTASTFLEAGWDFVGETENGTEDIWWIIEGKDYPRLWWEAADQR